MGPSITWHAPHTHTQKKRNQELTPNDAKRLMKEMDPPGAEKAYFALGCCELVAVWDCIWWDWLVWGERCVYAFNRGGRPVDV